MRKGNKGKMRYEHANDKGQGSGLCVGLGQCKETGRQFLDFEIYRQERSDGDAPRWQTLDSATFSADAIQAGHILAVLRGARASVNDGKGLVNAYDTQTQILHLDKAKPPKSGFAFHIINSYANGKKFSGRILLSEMEAVSLEGAIADSMSRLAFEG